MSINPKYKDRLFCIVFHEKENLLELYNAIHGTAYTDASQLEITTIQDAIYMSMKNDVSFLIGDKLNLYEHQSTLREYQFVGLELSEAVDKAVDDCIQHGIMAEWLSAHRAEVMNVLLCEYDEQEHIRMEREEAWEDGNIAGRAVGLTEGETLKLISMIQKKLRKGKSLEVIAEELEEDADIIRPIFEVATDNPDDTAEHIYGRYDRRIKEKDA